MLKCSAYLDPCLHNSIPLGFRARSRLTKGMLPALFYTAVLRNNFISKSIQCARNLKLKVKSTGYPVIVGLTQGPGYLSPPPILKAQKVRI